MRQVANGASLFTPAVVAAAFDALHLVYEGYHLNQLKLANLLPVGNLLCAVATRLGWKSFSDYYQRSGSERYDYVMQALLLRRSTLSSVSGSLTRLFVPPHTNPPSIYEWIYDCLGGKRTPFPIYPALPTTARGPTDFIRKICSLYQLLCFGSAEGCFSKKIEATVIVDVTIKANSVADPSV